MSFLRRQESTPQFYLDKSSIFMILIARICGLGVAILSTARVRGRVLFFVLGAFHLPEIIIKIQEG